MIITGEHNIKILKKALLVLMASIEASLTYVVDSDLTSGYLLLKKNADQVLTNLLPQQVITRSNPTPSLEITAYCEQRAAIIALHKLINEYQAMKNKMTNEMIDLYNNILTQHNKEIDDPESRKKNPVLVTLDGEPLEFSGLGTG